MTTPDTPHVATAATGAPDLTAWIGRTERMQDVVTLFPVKALDAALDRPGEPAIAEATLAPLRHWLYFLPVFRRSDTGPDGHGRRGGFLPPVTLPRRMWAGGRLDFRHPLRVGDVVERESRIERVETKQGRTGVLVFVLVRHEIRARGEIALVEEHDIVYREAPPASSGAGAPSHSGTVKRPAPANPDWEQEFIPDEVLLFRYSALTFNGHRIHYDRRYVMEEEGYPGLVVHGPLIATLLADLARDRSGAALSTFAFRAVNPLFDIAPFRICGRREAEAGTLSLWAQDREGNLAMEATATLR